MRKNITTNTRCASGEHYVASYLSALGLVVGLTRQGAQATDLFATSPQGKRLVSIQVKTGGIYSNVTYKRTPEYDYWVWRVGKPAIPSDFHWYAFVYVGDWPKEDEAPKIFFVPSKLVAKSGSNIGTNKGWFWMYKITAENHEGGSGFRNLTLRSCLHPPGTADGSGYRTHGQGARATSKPAIALCTHGYEKVRTGDGAYTFIFFRIRHSCWMA